MDCDRASLGVAISHPLTLGKWNILDVGMKISWKTKSLLKTLAVDVYVYTYTHIYIYIWMFLKIGGNHQNGW